MLPAAVHLQDYHGTNRFGGIGFLKLADRLQIFVWITLAMVFNLIILLKCSCCRAGWAYVRGIRLSALELLVACRAQSPS